MFLFLILENVMELKWEGLLQTFGYTLLFSSLPIGYRMLQQHNYLLRKRLAESIALNESLYKKKSNDLSLPDVISFKSSIVQDEFRTNFDQLLYIESDQNYIKIVEEKDGETKISLFRQPIKEAIEQSGLARCHRSFAVNLRKVVSTSGNSQGLKLHFENKDVISVSRTYHFTIKNLIDSLEY